MTTVGRTPLFVTLAALLVVAGCGGPKTAPAPEPGTVRGTPPDLRGRRVAVFPVQAVAGIAGDADAELAFGLRDRGRDVIWIFPPELEELLRQSPSISARTRGLSVTHFLAAEVKRVGDPLYGNLRRMAVLANAEAVIVPILAATTQEVGEAPRVTMTVTMIEPRTGRVMWFAILQGQPFADGDPAGLASAVDEVARRLLWYVGE